MTTRHRPTTRHGGAVLIVALALSAGCGGGAPPDWYYHWNCHGHQDCIDLNPTGQPAGTQNEGPEERACTPLLTFARINWGPAATNSCDHDPNGNPDAGGTPAPSATLQSITVAPAGLSLPVGKSQQLTATGHYSDGGTKDLTGQVAWARTYLGAVTVTPGGLVTATEVGTNLVTASLSGHSGSASVTVVSATLQSVAVAPASPRLALGASLLLTAVGTYSDGSTVTLAGATWSSGTPAVATVAAGGLATAVAEGTTLVTTSFSGLSGSTTLTVTPPALVSITVSPADLAVGVGFGQQLTATGTDSDGATRDLTALASWGSDTPAVATVDPGGFAHGLAAGTTQVSASFGGLSGSTSLTVTAAALVSIAISPALPSLAPGETLHLTALGTFSDGLVLPLGSGVTWSSSLLAVASASVAGTVTGNDLGVTTITASASGKQGSTPLTVTRTGLVWSARAPPTLQPLSAVTFAGAQFVAVGGAGAVVTSPDGAAWTAQGSGTGAPLSGVTWTGAQVVAVGGTGTVLTSPDGVAWTTRASGSTAALLAAAWTGSQLVAVGASGTILTSPDGIAWTARTSGTTYPLGAVAWSGAHLVAVGGGLGPTDSGGVVLTSPDGVAWTQATFSFGALFGVALAPTLDVVAGALVSSNLRTGVTTRRPWAATSSDDVSWSSAGVGGTAFLRGVTWTGALYVAVGDLGTILTSPDGRAWTARSSGTSAGLSGVGWSGTSLVAVGEGGALLVSP